MRTRFRHAPVCSTPRLGETLSKVMSHLPSAAGGEQRGEPHALGSQVPRPRSHTGQSQRPRGALPDPEPLLSPPTAPLRGCHGADMCASLTFLVPSIVRGAGTEPALAPG